MVTLAQLTRIFEQRKNYDLRNMIRGSERLLDSPASALDTDPSFMLAAVRQGLFLDAWLGTHTSTMTVDICFAAVVDVDLASMVQLNEIVTMAEAKRKWPRQCLKNIARALYQ